MLTNENPFLAPWKNNYDAPFDMCMDCVTLTTTILPQLSIDLYVIMLSCTKQCGSLQYYGKS